MKILKCTKFINFESNTEISDNKAVAFDEKIVDIGDFENLKLKFADAQIIEIPQSVISPAFINPHTHLEYSANSSTLVYGDFLKWVQSVVKSRTELSKNATDELISSKIASMMKSGVATIGEISSFGSDFRALESSPARVIFFNEILGADETEVGEKWSEFQARFEASAQFKSAKFIPAISVHSPYSTHPKLTKMACEFAKSLNLPLCAHFLESNHEKEWLNKSSGGFRNWLENFSTKPEPFYDEDSFIAYFSGLKTLFTHCVYVSDFSKFETQNHAITHCAFSNRLLSKKTLDILQVLRSGLNLNIATDGLSSNISLNFFDELRSNLLIHSDIELHILAEILWKASTINPANALNISSGSLNVGKFADIAVYKLPKCDDSELLLQLILQTSEVQKIFIGGEECKF